MENYTGGSLFSTAPQIINQPNTQAGFDLGNALGSALGNLLNTGLVAANTAAFYWVQKELTPKAEAQERAATYGMTTGQAIDSKSLMIIGGVGLAALVGVALIARK